MTTIRALHRDDDAQVTKLWAEAFGEWDEPAPHVNPIDRPGRNIWCAERDGQVLATVNDREFDTWLGGAAVPTAGIASVAVQAEVRGQGLLTPLFERMLAGSRERGALISSLFPTAPGIYRRFGYAPIASLDRADVPTTAFVVAGDRVPTRRATPDDLPGIRAVHTRWASQHNGPLTRTGPSFPDADAFTSFTAISVAESSPGRISGFVSWARGEGYGAGAKIRVDDLIADDPASLASLMNVVGSFASVADTVAIRTSGRPEWEHLLRLATPQPTQRVPYMMAVLHVAVLEQLSYPDGLELGLPFSWQGTGHVLSVADGRAHVEPADVGAARALDGPGLALTITGAQRSPALRCLGHLTGDRSHDVFWDFLFGSRLPAVRDYF